MVASAHEPRPSARVFRVRENFPLTNSRNRATIGLHNRVTIGNGLNGGVIVAKRRAVEWVRGQQAAQRLGVTRPTVLAMVARKELRAKVEGDVLLVRADDVERAAQKAA